MLDAGSSLVQTYIFHNGRLNNSVGTIGYHNRARDDRGIGRLEIGSSSPIFRERASASRVTISGPHSIIRSEATSSDGVHSGWGSLYRLRG